MTLVLPKTAHIPTDKVEDYVYLFAGPKKFGKTSLAACAKNTLIIEGEPGNAKALPVRQVDITKWEEFIEITMLLEKTPGYCDTKVVDDVPSFYNMCMDYCCQKFGFDHPQDLGFGKGWKIVDAEFQKRLKKIQAIPGGTIYTAHTAIKEVENRHGKKFNKLETSMTGQADRCMDALVQLWGTMEYGVNDERLLTIRGNDYVKAGCGFPNRFHYTSGEEIRQIPLGKSAQEGWNNFVLAFENKLVKPEEKQPIKQVSIPLQKPKGMFIKKSGL